MKLDFNRKYTTIAVYAFLVIAAGLLFQNIVNDIPPLTRYFNKIGDLLLPFIVGGALAYILNPILNWIEHRLFPVIFRDKVSRKIRRGLSVLLSYLFMIFVMPVGPYFKGGFATNPYVVIRQYDRSAPLGTGIYKVGGNYAASMKANKLAHDLGYSCEFYLDAKEKKYIDECGAANFFGIKENTYVTPKSTSILPSITNKSLMQLAEDMGLKVERRQIPIEELDSFEEAGACGTAAVISPIERIDDLEEKRSYVISKDGKPGPICRKLYDTLRGIQYGDIEDRHGWVTVVE